MVMVFKRLNIRLVNQNVVEKNVKYFCTKFMDKKKIAVHEAEKVIGYPTSFLNLRWLLNDEAANIVLNFKKIIGHPLLATARELIFDTQSPSWGLIVLLVSKAGGLTKTISQHDCDVTTGILHNQRVLAEVSEMLRTSNTIHKTIVDISPKTEYGEDYHFGNKIGILSGDYILASIFKDLADLRACDISFLVSSCVRDMTEAAFFEPTDRHNRPLPAPPNPNQNKHYMPEDSDKSINISEVLGNAKAEWTIRHLLGGASTLGKCCQGAVQLAYQTSLQNASYLVGRNTALALQVRSDIVQLESNKTTPFSLINAPLMFHFQEDPFYYDHLMKAIEEDNVDYNNIRNVVSAGNGIEKSLEMKEEFVNNGIQALTAFSASDSKNALINLLRAI